MHYDRPLDSAQIAADLRYDDERSMLITVNVPRFDYSGEPRYTIMLCSNWVVFDDQYTSYDQGDDDFSVANFDDLEEAVARYPDSQVA